MADLQFPNLGNALLAGATAAYQLRHGQRENDAERRRQEAQSYYGAAAQGDPNAIAKVASGDPHGATAMATMLARLDADKRAGLKAAAEFAANGAHAVLQADPADKASVYSSIIAQGKANGYKINLPDTYSPALDGQLRGYRAQSTHILDNLTKIQMHNTPAGGAPTVIDLPTGGAQPPQGDATPNARPGGPYAAAGNAIGGIESRGQPNGGYGAIGPAANDKGQRAYGKYQVMDFNVGPWTQEALGKAMTPQEYLANPEAQDAVFNHKFGQYVQKYGSPQAAARAWFAGEGGMNNPGGADVNGMTVARYENQFSNALGGGGPQPAPMPPPPAGLAPSLPPAQMPGAPQGLIPPGPPPARMPLGPIASPPQMTGMEGGAIPGVPQGDSTPQADGSGNPLPPAGAQSPQGEIPVKAGIAQDDPTKYGFRQRGISKNGVVTPQVIDGGFFVFRDPRTGREVLYNPRHDPANIRSEAEAKRKAENPDAVPGPFPATSVQGNSLNILIQDKVLTRNQAAQVALGRVVTGADGAQYYISGDQIISAAGGARPAPVTPQAPGAPVVGSAPPAGGPVPAPQPSGGPVQLTAPKPQGPSPTEMAKLREMDAEGGSIIKALDDFEKEFKKAGFGTRAKSAMGINTPLNTSFSNAALLAKGEALYNLGVLNGPDLDIIRRTIPDPSSMRSAGVSDADMSEAVGKVRDLIKTRLNEKKRSLGLPQSPAESAGPAKQGGGDLLGEARAAIQKGAPRDAVIKRLREMGVEGEP